MKKLLRFDYLLVGIVALVYFLLLFSRLHTFQFFSGDSGDWLASSIWWMIPQPYGSPFFISIGHLLNWVPFGSLVVKMTIVMDVIPSAISVAVVYLICKKFTTVKIALVCALVLLGSAVFLTQATILDEFAVSGMFVTLAYYFYIQDKRKLTVLMLALGSAIQIIVIAISFLWYVLHLNEVKKWYKTYWIYVVFGLLPYSLILIMMYLPTPRLLSGSLSLAGIDNYLGATGTIASMSLFETPKRILEFCSVLLASLGLAIVPIFVSLKGITKYGKSMLVLAVTVLFGLWLYLTDSDPGTWHFLPITFPLIMVFVAIGLNKMPKINRRIVFSGACVLIIVNGIFLNANILSKQYPLAVTYENNLKSLPDNSWIVSNSGGNYGLDNYYMMASGVPIRPIFIDGDIPDVAMFSSTKEIEYEKYLVDYLETNYNIKPAQAQTQVDGMIKHKLEVKLSPRYQGYLQWMGDKYGLQGTNTLAQVEWLLSQGMNVYVCKPSITPYWQGVFQTTSYDETLDKIVGINLQ